MINNQFLNKKRQEQRVKRKKNKQIYSIPIKVS